jgi:hypothetical protein
MLRVRLRPSMAFLPTAYLMVLVGVVVILGWNRPSRSLPAWGLFQKLGRPGRALAVPNNYYEM